MGLIRVSDKAEKEIKELSKGKTIVKMVDQLLAERDGQSSIPDYRKQVGRFELVELISQHQFPELPLSSKSVQSLVAHWREYLYSLPEEEREEEHNNFWAGDQIYEQYEEGDAVLSSRWVISRNRICVIEFSNRVPIINLTDYVLDRLVELGELV